MYDSGGRRGECRRSRKTAQIWTDKVLTVSRPSALRLLLLSALLRLLGLALPIRLAFNGDDLGVVRQSVNERL